MKNVYVFFNWLSNRNSLKSFIHNWEKYNSKKCTLKQYSRYCSKCPEFWIDDAFSWAESSEGYDFWEKCHYEWQNFCQQHSSDFEKTEITISIY